jgi:hypothetical protein
MASNLVWKLIALNFNQKVLNFCKIFTPKILGCYSLLSHLHLYIFFLHILKS